MKGEEKMPRRKKNEPVIENSEDEEEDESLSVWDAADIWLSNGKDEDYMFGYTREELERASR